jgi:hypothetical protein
MTYGSNVSMNANLVNGVNDRFLLSWKAADLQGTLILQAYSAGGASVITNPTPSGFGGNTNVYQYLMFSSFNTVAGSGVNWGNVTKLVLQINGPGSADYTLDEFLAVPEPNTLTLVLVGMLGAVVLRRRAS